MSGVSFACGSQRLRVNARITIDASDLGDIIRLSGAAYSAGPDSSARFGETNAPETIDDSNRNGMNPVTHYQIAKAGASPVQHDPATLPNRLLTTWSCLPTPVTRKELTLSTPVFTLIDGSSTSPTAL